MKSVSILFLLAAILLGLTLLLYVLNNKHTPKALVLSHGFFAAIGLLAVVIYGLISHVSIFMPAFILVTAALGGFILAWRDLVGLSVPKWLAVGHGLMALAGVALLVIELG